MSNQNKTSATSFRSSMGKGPIGAVEKPKNLKQALKKLYLYIRAYLPFMIIAILFAIISAVLLLFGPNQLQEITNIILDGLFSGVDTSAVTRIGVLLVILFGIGFVLSYLQGFIMATVTQRITKKMRQQISEKINRLPLKYLDSKPYGEVLSRVTNDVDTIGQTLNNSVGIIVGGTALLLGSIVMMFYTNWIMAITAIVSSLIGIACMGMIMHKSQKYFIAQQQSLGQVNGHIEEIYSAHHVVKVYNGEQESKEKFDSINNQLFSSAWKSQFFSGLMMPIMNFVGNLGYVAVCVVGATLAMNNMIEFGVIVSFMIYIRYFSQPLGQLAQAMTNLQSASAAGERVFEFIEEKELDNESHKTKMLQQVKGDVEFSHVQFGYDPEKIIIHDFSARFKAGQKVAIVGPTGAGKTTLVNLLMRFYEVTSGDILIDGVSTKELTRVNVHDLFGMVLQDTWLFEGTIEQNIIYSKTGVTSEQVVEACKVVGLDHFIKTLPQGYQTKLTDATTISSGQRQLLTIARAMVQNSPMLILDEATSSVDTRTEILIQKAMDTITQGRTSFVIAHRLSTIKNADVILVLKDGDIVEMGNHKQLMEKNGHYADLYNSQFDVVS